MGNTIRSSYLELRDFMHRLVKPPLLAHWVAVILQYGPVDIFCNRVMVWGIFLLHNGGASTNQGRSTESSPQLVKVYLWDLSLFLEKDAMEGFSRSRLPLSPSVSSGVKVRCPSAYFMRAFVSG
eukprot:4808934-Ditylum_brightwellii.AAC.1